MTADKKIGGARKWRQKDDLVLLSSPPWQVRSPTGERLFAWVVAGFLWFAGFAYAAGWSAGLTLLLLVLYAAAMAAFLVDSVRRSRITAPILKAFRKALPSMSQTERDALEAGTVWWEGELFAGNPDWNKMLGYAWPRLSPEEQSFLDIETTELCRLTDDWQSTQKQDLPEAVWKYIKEKGFLGMIIPKEYGGKGFSAYAHSQVVTKLSTRSSAPAVTVMVPNSLGPAELLLHYGTPEQKKHYLPRLAAGQEIPAFALTSPWAGSDAAAIPDSGVIERAPGRAGGARHAGFLRQALHHAGAGAPCSAWPSGSTTRITCWATPRTSASPARWSLEPPRRGHRPPSLPAERDLDERPDPRQGRLHAAGLHHRRPEDGRPGLAHAHGVPCRRAAISLPGSNTGMQKMTARAVGAYARVRYQFKTAIGRFEGVEEALTRIGANTYLCDAGG